MLFIALSRSPGLTARAVADSVRAATGGHSAGGGGGCDAGPGPAVSYPIGEGTREARLLSAALGVHQADGALAR